MERIYRPTLEVRDIEDSHYAIFGPAAKIDWMPYNRESLERMLIHAIEMGTTDRYDTLRQMIISMDEAEGQRDDRIA